MNKRLLIGIGALATLGAVAYLATGQSKPAPSPVPQQAQEPTSTTESANPMAEKVIEVSGSEYSFLPKSLELKAGEPVKLTYKNTGKLPHDLTITELGVRTKVIAGGKEDMITFTPDKSGTFTFFCSVGNHRQLGMEGSLEVK